MSDTIFDIPPPEIGREELDIRGKKLPIQGIGTDDWVALYKRFPELVKGAALGVTAAADNASPIDMVRMEAAICSAGCDKYGDEATELAIINNLTRNERQLVMMTAINLSRPGDVLGPLLASDAAAAGSSG